MAKKKTWQDLTDEEILQAFGQYSEGENKAGALAPGNLFGITSYVENERLYKNIAKEFGITNAKDRGQLISEYKRRVNSMDANQPATAPVGQPATTPAPQATATAPQPQAATPPIPAPTFTTALPGQAGEEPVQQIPMTTLTATLPTRQEYMVNGRKTGIFFNPQEGSGVSATRAINMDYSQLPRTAAGVQEGANALYDLTQFNRGQAQRITQEYQMGRPTSLTGLPNTQGVTVGVGPSIFQQYTPPSGGAVFGRSDRAAALERNRQNIEQSRFNRMTGPERQQYMARQAAMMGMREQAMTQQTEQANREALLEQERIKARGGVQAAQAGQLTPEQQMSEAQRERESRERIESAKVTAQYAENYAKQSGPERVNAYTQNLNKFNNAMKTFVDQQVLNSKLDPASIENFKLIQGQMSSVAWKDFQEALAEDLDKDAALFKEFEDMRKKSATEKANWMSNKFNQYFTKALNF